MPVHFDKDKKRWRFSFRRRIDRNRFQATKLLPAGWSQRQAEAYDRAESARLYAQATGVEKDRLPLAPAVQFYLDHRCPDLKNGKKVAQDLAHLIDLIEGAFLDQVADVADRYAKANPSLSAGTLHNRLAYLRAAVRYARKRHKYGQGLPDYAADMHVPTPNNERQVYARLPVLNQLWEAFEEDEARALFKMDFYMGLRWRAELLNRETEHIQRNGRDVWLQIGVTKNGRPVMKPVHPAVKNCLKYIPFQHGDSWFYKQWHAATAKIGRPDLLPHDLRHSLASEVLSRKGGTLDDVRAALHHLSVQASKRYAHLYPERMQAILLGVGEKIAHRRRSAARKRRVKVAVTA